MVSKAIKLILAMDGHEVETATNGQEALDAFQSRQFDLVITGDLMCGMSRTELAAATKALAPHQPVIAITAYAEIILAEGHPRLAVDLVVSKPFDAQQLREAVRELTARK